MVATPPKSDDETLPPAAWMAPGQKIGPQSPGQPWPDKAYDNLNVAKNKPEYAKKDSAHLRYPLQQEMADSETISISHDAVIVLKHHGSYMQQDRSFQRTDKQAYADSYQFMLRLKVPNGKLPASVYQTVDDISTKWGQNDLRATTRQAWQIHGVKKNNLKSVIAAIANAGGSTLGGCGDINRNIMSPPAPLADAAYQYAFQTANYIADLLAPSSPAFAELWMDGKKTATVEYWKKDMVEGSTSTPVIPPVAKSIEELNDQVSSDVLKDQGTGIITGDAEEPLYGRQYLPRKFKIAVTVPGDNSVDLFIHDVGLVVIMADDGKTLKGYDVFVGGGMGRTHNKESTFAKVSEPLGFVSKEDLPELMKAILATQRDHGNREVRANARMKYLVHSLGVANFRKLVESYFGKKISPMVPLPAWRMVDWMGWHEQGDGKLFLGVIVEQGRVKDFDNGLRLKTALRTIVDKYGLDTRLTADQNIVLCGIDPKDRSDIDAILLAHGVKPIEQVDMMTRKSIACPAFPLCGLAQAEAERRMPDFNSRVNALLDRVGMPGESFVMRMTGCPNGCARPYMAELAFVGQGPDLYQVWMGGSSQLDGRTGWRWKDKMKQSDLEAELEPVLFMWKTERTSQAERLGDFLQRVGKDKVDEYVAKYAPGTAFSGVTVETLYTGPVVGASGGGAKGARLTSGPRKQQVRVTDEVHGMLKQRADTSGQPISDLVEELILKGLN